jgi:hypothetical protein
MPEAHHIMHAPQQRTRFPREDDVAACYGQADIFLRGGNVGGMTSGAIMPPMGANSKISIGMLPAEILQHICSLLQDPDDLASCHSVDTRCARHVEVLCSTWCRGCC